jgi:hypothetical protein
MELAQNWAGVSNIEAGRAKNSEYAVMLRFHLALTPGVQLLQREGLTPDLFLTERQARELLLLLGHALGFPETGIESSPTKRGH